MERLVDAVAPGGVLSDQSMVVRTGILFIDVVGGGRCPDPARWGGPDGRVFPPSMSVAGTAPDFPEAQR